MLGGQELLIVFLIILLLFGAKKLPELAQGLGKGIREFKRAAREVEDIEELDKPKSQISNTTQSSEEKKA